MEEGYGEVLIYQTEDGLTSMDVKMQDETAVVREFRTTASDGI